MANQEQQQQQKKKMDHFSHKHPLILIEIEQDEMSKPEYNQRSLHLLCFGCTEKIGSGVPYYHCEEEDCPLFCLHHACAHLPATIKGRHSDPACTGELKLTKRRSKYLEFCADCFLDWYRFAYACSVCTRGVDIRCARRRPNEAKHSFHQHPVQPFYYPPMGQLCSVCSQDMSYCSNYRCNYCNFIVHPRCTNVPRHFKSPSHPQHELYLDFEYPGSKICKICQEEIDLTTQWAYKCGDCSGYYIHAANDDCLTSTIRKGDLQHFHHDHPLTLVEQEEEAPPTLDGTHSDDERSILKDDCHCCRQKISLSVPYYICIHCNKYRLHKLCAHLPREIEHPLHPNFPPTLHTPPHAICDVCDEKFNGFAYGCFRCKFDLDIQCALKTHKMDKIFHKHPLFLSPTKGPYKCHACDRGTKGSSYQCTYCKFWVHEQCASLPTVKKRSSHEHDLELVYTIPEKYSGVVVYCRICTTALKDQRWAYHCNRCRYLTHVHDCSDPLREGDGVTISESDVVHLPLAGEPLLEEVFTNGKMIKHHRHSMILFADQFKSNAIDLTPYLKILIRGSETWPTFHVDGKDYSGPTFSFHNSMLTMSVTGVDLPRYIKHESHPHVLESTVLNSFTWCHACEQSFFGRGFKCTTCAFTIDTYCALLPRIIKHRYDKHGFSLTYSAIEGVEEYVCEICEEDVTPRYFYHCVACDLSIHARCIWHAYVGFERRYRFDRDRWPVVLVPPGVDVDHPKCIICQQNETFGHGFSFRGVDYCKFMVHLTCITEDDVHTY